MSLVPGKVALANESDQNSAALKNVTIDTGTVKFNTAIEYDTDAAFTSYSRVKHYIIGGKAYSYSYDDAGNIAKIQNPDGSWVSYEYDALNQLTKETHSDASTIASPFGRGGGVADGEGNEETTVSCTTVEYSYDTRGNILSKTYSDGENTTVVSYAYNGAWKDQLTSFNGVSIEYDEIGNPKNWVSGETLLWQHGCQLASYAKDGKTITYTYNADSIRTSKTVDGVKTSYNVIDGVLRSMTCGTDTLQFLDNSVVFNGTQYWYVQNAQNDVIGLIDSTGNYVVQYTYDSWGKLLSMTCPDPDDTTLATLNPFRYRGYIYDDETGLYYCQSRYYDPAVGRFLNSDRQITTTQGIGGYNLFAYCGNNPIMRADPSGNSWLLVGLIVAGAVFLGGCSDSESTVVTTITTTPVTTTTSGVSSPTAFKTLTNEEKLFVATVAGESIGEKELEQKAVAHTIMNRVYEPRDAWSNVTCVSDVLASNNWYNAVGGNQFEICMNYLNNRDGSNQLYENLISNIIPIYYGEEDDFTGGAHFIFNITNGQSSYLISALDAQPDRYIKCDAIPGVDNDKFCMYRCLW